ncbi:MAG: NnrU family protein [Beijerinckiaceae bacterium]|jgi:uncharacterized membrane protein|nr:NnrU family protein [Beijerinckiaceae bacterium]
MNGLLAGWGEFGAALAGFFASHALPVRPNVRRRITALIGEQGFTIAYSALSLAMLAWLVLAAGRAPHVTLWAPAPWQFWAPNIAMPLVCLLLAMAVGAPNPLSFGGARNERFDPERPGIAGATRHPLLLALAIWAGAHLVPNGDLAHAILFGLFAGFALLGMAIIDRRKRRLMGVDRWQGLAINTSPWPFAAWLGGRWRPDLRPFPVMRLTIAAALYALLLMLHEPLIGVSPWPF